MFSHMYTIHSDTILIIMIPWGRKTRGIWNAEKQPPCLQPVAAISHLQPFEWPKVAASGRKWLLGVQIPVGLLLSARLWIKNTTSRFFSKFAITRWNGSKWWMEGKSWDEKIECLSERRTESKGKGKKQRTHDLKPKDRSNKRNRRVAV